ncbi:MAG TPA: EF-hand domain-containing protein [Pirellulales bacterium]|jgi:Ca2+-binding EF-hand superfamily protein|nr:EF-hand domain-containing protein [Pirellulales bacterium]
MRKTFSRLLLVAAACGLFAIPASAADKPKRDPAEVFKKLDKDGNGKLSLEEFTGKKTGDDADKAKAAFTKLDTDKDGSLTLDEFKNRKKK